MTRFLGSVWRFIVGQEHGFGDEGIDQWYYTVAISISLMLTWWLKPEIALVFTILSVIHYLTVVLFGAFDLIENKVSYSYIYFGVHLVLLLVALFTNYMWALITMGIAVISYLLSIIDEYLSAWTRKIQSKQSLLINTFVLIAFVIVDFLLPIKLWIRFAILASALVLHPLIDYTESFDIGILDTTADICDKIKESIFHKKEHGTI